MARAEGGAIAEAMLILGGVLGAGWVEGANVDGFDMDSSEVRGESYALASLCTHASVGPAA